MSDVAVIGNNVLADSLALAARLAREIEEREAVMLELLDTAIEHGASLRDVSTITGVPRSTLSRKLSRPVPPFAGQVSDPDLAAELDALRRRRLAHAREQVDAAEAHVEEWPEKRTI